MMATTMKSKPAATMDEYIAGFPKDIQKMLELLRATIRKSAPKAEETIKYAIPTFTLNGNLVSFAAWKDLKRNLLFMLVQKAQPNFRWISRFHWH